MNQREKILAGVVLALVALWGGKTLYGRYGQALDSRIAQVADTRRQLSELKRKVADGRDAADKIDVWQRQSLPEDREKALSIYKAWLSDKANAAGLVVDIDPLERTTSSKDFSTISYQLKGTGSLSAVAAMLYEIYRSPMLQQVTRLQLNRPVSGAQLTVTLDVEALLMPGSATTDGVPEGDSKRLKLASLKEYQQVLTDRELANAYTPPRPPRPPRETRVSAVPPKFDDAEQARFSAVVGSSKGWQAWINVRTTGVTLFLFSGDSMKVGAMEGQVVSVDRRSLVFESDGKQFVLLLGQFLHEAKEVNGPSSETKDATTGRAKSEVAQSSG